MFTAEYILVVFNLLWTKCYQDMPRHPGYPESLVYMNIGYLELKFWTCFSVIFHTTSRFDTIWLSNNISV